MRKLKLIDVLLLITLLASCSIYSVSFAQAEIVSNGKSTFSIVLPQNAPATLQEAALELQKDIQLSSGALLPIEKDTASLNHPFISLGNTQQARSAGFDATKMADESYRIVTKNSNLYIFGKDTADGNTTSQGGISNGTANGVYVFLEDYLGVRWLMPGEIGFDVPAKSTFTIGNIDRSETPIFNYRLITDSIAYYSNKNQLQNITGWLHHMRIGTSSTAQGAFRGSVKLDYNHNWWRTINDDNSSRVDTPEVRALYKEHPDWFAMDANGKRTLPVNRYDKLETTNPELVKWFADKAVQAIKASKTPRMYSLSPSDGRAWSQSPESKALYDPVPNAIDDPEAPKGNPSMSSLILKWYHDVAQIVEEECPDCKLGGFIYADYIYPPRKYQMKLPENFTPVLAASFNYGYGLYRPEVQKQFRETMESWAKVAPADWYYYDLPNILMRQYIGDIGSLSPPINFPGSTGIVLPAAPDILNIIFPTLLQSHIKGCVLYSADSWSSGAMTNYVLAKMMWNPKLNAADVQRDWLQHAYGIAAGSRMEQFYAKLNGWFRAYYQAGKGQSYNLSVDMLREVYAAHYPELEKILLQAKAQSMTAAQQKRLQLIEDNMIVLQWRLRNARLLPDDFHSALDRTNDQVIQLIETPSPNFALFPGAAETNLLPWIAPKPFPWKVLLDTTSQLRISKDALPNELKDTTILFASRDGEIRITPKSVTQGAFFASFNIKDASGKEVVKGILNQDTPIVFSAKANSAYYLTVIPRLPVKYTLQVQDALLASGSFDAKSQTLTLTGKPAAIHVFQAVGNHNETSDAVSILKN